MRGAAAAMRQGAAAGGGTTQPSIVRSDKATSGSSTGGTLTFGAAATAGDLIVVAVGFSIQSARTVTITGFTTLDQITTNAVNNAAMAILYKVAAGGETSVTWAISGTADYNSATSFFVHGQNATPFDQHAVIQRASSTTPVSPSITPAVANTLALGFVSTDGFHDISTPPSGWVENQAAMSSLHTTHALSDSSSPGSGVSLSFTPTLSGSDNTALAILTIQP